MIWKILQSGRRQLHTIISREMIKPSSPTPSHLQIYNLSQVDRYMIPHHYMPLFLLYPNNNDTGLCLTLDEKARVMKKALSQSLTKWYPLAGRLLTPTTPYIDCNDKGVVFVEAKHDTQMDKFQHMSLQDESVGQFFANGMVWHNSTDPTILVGVQLNHFACGGLAVAVSMSHTVGDASTLYSYINYLASVARYGSTDHKDVLPLNPHFIQSPAAAPINIPLEASSLEQRSPNRSTRKFVFPNSKLNELKNKVLALADGSGSTLNINNPTRYEVLSSLLYKTATTPTSSSFKPSFLVCLMDIRKKFVPELPQTTVGNVIASLLITSRHASDTSLSVVVSEIRKQKMQFQKLRSLKLASESFDRLANEDVENVTSRTFWCSSLCGLPFYKVDFGWGKPTVAIVTLVSSNFTGSILMDSPNGDAIEAWVTLETQDMEAFENDKEMLLFCKN